MEHRPAAMVFLLNFISFFFWTDLKMFFLAMCAESLANGSLPKTVKKGIIVLIPKRNKPRNLIKSYRPTTLLNVCYKIVSATIANRLKTVLQYLIDSSQSAHLRGRFIGDNIRLVYDIIQFAKLEKTSGILMSLDIEAVFVSVS